MEDGREGAKNGELRGRLGFGRNVKKVVQKKEGSIKRGSRKKGSWKRRGRGLTV